MRKTVISALFAGAVMLGSTAAYSAAQPAQNPQTTQTPKGWSYDIKNGQRIPKGNRITNPDGSWREELKQGNCVTVKEKAASGEYKETRQCNQG